MRTVKENSLEILKWLLVCSQDLTHLTLLKHQNTKTFLYKLSKNHWVITLLESFGSDRRNLQSTVSLDHPVVIVVIVVTILAIVVVVVIVVIATLKSKV